MMRESIVLDNSYLGSFHNDNKLKVDNVQSMSWVGSDDVGPSDARGQEKKND